MQKKYTQQAAKKCYLVVVSGLHSSSNRGNGLSTNNIGQLPVRGLSGHFAKSDSSNTMSTAHSTQFNIAGVKSGSRASGKEPGGIEQLLKIL